MIRLASFGDLRREVALARARKRRTQAGIGFTLGASRAAGGGGIDPTTRVLSGYWRGSFSAAPWVGTASAGTSGTQDLQTAGADPAVGASQGGFTPADFDGTNDTLAVEGTLTDYATSTGFCGWILIRPDDVTVGTLWGTTGGVADLFLTGSTANFQINGGAATASRAIAASSYSIVTFRYDGAFVQIGVNENPGASGGASSVAFSTPITTLTDTINVGDADIGGDPYNGRIMEFATKKNAVLIDSEFKGIRKFVGARYGLSGL